jgi:hypothetical protein
MITIDLSKLSHLDLRQALAVKLAERDKLTAGRDAAVAALGQQREPYEAAYDASRKEAQRARDDERNASERFYNAEIGRAASVLATATAVIDQAEAAAEKPYDEAIGALDAEIEALLGPDHCWRRDEYGDDYFERCALCGLPVHDDDDVLAEEDSGTLILRALLPSRATD